MGAPTVYARKGPGEDFAETFMWFVLGGGSKTQTHNPYNPKPGVPDLPRRLALKVALDKFP